MQDSVTSSGPCVDTAKVFRSDQIKFDTTCAAGDSNGFSFDKTFPDAWSVAEGEMCILESFSLFDVRPHVENGFFLKSFALIYAVSRKVIPLSEISAVNFMVG